MTIARERLVCMIEKWDQLRGSWSPYQRWKYLQYIAWWCTEESIEVPVWVEAALELHNRRCEL